MEAIVPWVKFVHLSALLVWSAGLLAMPLLLALYPTLSGGRVDRRRLWAASRFTYIAVSSPAAVVAVVSGTALIHVTGSYGTWMLAKLTLVAALVLFHCACGKVLLLLHETPQRWSAGFHRSLAAVPEILIPCVLWLVLAQPRFA